MVGRAAEAPLGQSGIVTQVGQTADRLCMLPRTREGRPPLHWKGALEGPERGNETPCSAASPALARGAAGRRAAPAGRRIHPGTISGSADEEYPWPRGKPHDGHSQPGHIPYTGMGWAGPRGRVEAKRPARSETSAWRPRWWPRWRPWGGARRGERTLASRGRGVSAQPANNKSHKSLKKGPPQLKKLQRKIFK